MGVIKREATPGEMAAPVGPGGFAVRLSGSYPTSTDEARQRRAADLGGQRWAYLHGGTAAVEAYRQARAAGADEASARGAATMVQGQQAAGGAPLTRSDILTRQVAGQAGRRMLAAGAGRAEAETRLAEALPGMATARIQQQRQMQIMEQFSQLAEMYPNDADKQRIAEIAERLITGQDVPPGWWEWIIRVMGQAGLALYRSIFGEEAVPPGGQ